MFERSDAHKVAKPELLNPAEKYPRLSRPLGTGPQWGLPRDDFVSGRTPLGIVRQGRTKVVLFNCIAEH
jgi:hypothetical protein